jgi:4'-phosphopantetheinyl transferase
LRQLLAQYAAARPASLEFSYGPNGKPFLANNNCNVSFNVSRSRPYSMIVLTNGLSPGIDIEVIRPVQEYREIASRYFTPRELDWLNSKDEKDRVRDFFRIWVLKEALLKADGRGLSLPLSTVDMELSDTPLSASLWRLWRLWELNSREDCLAGVALDSAITSFVTFRSPQDCPANP